MPKKTKADQRLEQVNTANAVFNQVIRLGSNEFGLVWLYANIAAKEAVSDFVDPSDPVIRAVIVASIEAALRQVKPT